MHKNDSIKGDINISSDNSHSNINPINNKDKLLEVVFSLSLKYGFDNVSIKQIQEEADVSIGIIYYYFKDKNDILVNVVEKYIKDEIKKFKKNLINYEGSFPEKLKFIFYHFAGKDWDSENYGIELSNNEKINHADYELFLLGVYHQHPDLRTHFHELNSEMLNIFKDFVEEFKEKKEIKININVDDVALNIFTVAAGFIKLWIGFPSIPLKKFVDTNIKMICNDIGYKYSDI